MKHILIIFLCFFSFIALSQTKEKNYSIDNELSKCLNKKDISNAEMCNCNISAKNSWDKELNRYYNLLMTKLPVKAKEDLKQSQKIWISYREKEFKFISTYYYEAKEGTMWYGIAEEKKMDFVKNRVLELENYFETLDY